VLERGNHILKFEAFHKTKKSKKAQFLKFMCENLSLGKNSCWGWCKGSNLPRY